MPPVGTDKLVTDLLRNEVKTKKQKSDKARKRALSEFCADSIYLFENFPRSKICLTA